MATSTRKFIVCGVLILTWGSAATQEPDQADLDAMRAAAKSYAEAWLTNDADAVMSTFVDEPVLSPSGLPYVDGQAAARAFWFPPDSPPTRVTDFELTGIALMMAGVAITLGVAAAPVGVPLTALGFLLLVRAVF